MENKKIYGAVHQPSYSKVQPWTIVPVLGNQDQLLYYHIYQETDLGTFDYGLSINVHAKDDRKARAKAIAEKISEVLTNENL